MPEFSSLFDCFLFIGVYVYHILSACAEAVSNHSEDRSVGNMLAWYGKVKDKCVCVNVYECACVCHRNPCESSLCNSLRSADRYDVHRFIPGARRSTSFFAM